MVRGPRGICWMLFWGVIYLTVAAAVKPWARLPDVGDIGFTVVFVGFALTHCWAVEGGRRTAAFFAISAVVSYLMEEAGVRTGLVFGAYHYGGMLGPKLGNVPFIIPLAWFMMIYPSWMVGRALLRGVDAYTLTGRTAVAVVAAIAMTAWDVVMDPGMAAAGNWTWEKGGVYFGVPRHNYAGWLVTTFLVYWIAGWLWREAPVRTVRVRVFTVLPILVYAGLAVRYVMANAFPALQLVAVFAMGLPGLVAVAQVFLGRDGDGDALAA